jgi:hypothetical protein
MRATGTNHSQQPASKLDAGWFLAAFMALALLLLAPKIGQTITIVVLIAMVGCLVHPLSQLTWVRSSITPKIKAIRFSFLLAATMVAVGLFGIYVWPSVLRHVLDEKERQAFEKPLKKQAKGEHEELRLGCPAYDEAVCSYAGQFVQMFVESGWIVEENEVSRLQINRSPAGILLFRRRVAGGTFNSVAQASPGTIALYRAFANIGVQVDLATTDGIEVNDRTINMPDNFILVYFGVERPDESEGTQLTRKMKLLEQMQKKGQMPPVRGLIP